MAFKDGNIFSNGFFYNLTMAVGPGCPNRRDDVMLVQYCLKKTFENPTVVRPPLPPYTGKKIVVDGNCGTITLKAIERYQKLVKQTGGTAKLDKVVDRAITKGGFASISHTFYTIINLNIDLIKVIGQGNFDNLAGLSDVPSLLASSIGEVGSEVGVAV